MNKFLVFLLLVICVSSCDETKRIDSSKSNIVESAVYDGKAIFQADCASCHHPLKDETGPAFLNITKKRSADWIFKFVTDRSSLKNDLDSMKYENFSSEFNCPEFSKFSKEQVQAIFDYIGPCKIGGRSN